MNHSDINRIVAEQFNTTPEELMNARGYAGSYPRCAAMLICHELLHASTLKLKEWYGKRQHTTPLRALITARNRIQCDKDFRIRYNAALLLVKALQTQENDKKQSKKVYNLNHRVKQKGFNASTRSHTIQCTADKLDQLNGKQLGKLLNDHHYVIQLQLL